jgi:hypothetical protein
VSTAASFPFGGLIFGAVGLSLDTSGGVSSWLRSLRQSFTQAGADHRGLSGGYASVRQRPAGRAEPRDQSLAREETADSRYNILCKDVSAANKFLDCGDALLVRGKLVGAIDHAADGGLIVASAPGLVYPYGFLSRPLRLGRRSKRLVIAERGKVRQCVCKRSFKARGTVPDDDITATGGKRTF